MAAQPSTTLSPPLLSSSSQPVATPPPPLPRPKWVYPGSTHPVHKTLAGATNLANLLPTGTVLAFRTLTPSFSNKGNCNLSNICLTAFLIAFCALVCFLSSFTDSFVDLDGNLNYGIATFRGLYIFNNDKNNNNYNSRDELEKGNDDDDYDDDIDLTKYKIKWIDFVHAMVSLLVFLVFALADSDVQSCLFPLGGENMKTLVMNLPLGAGVFASFLFMIFPTTRRGIGYAQMQIKPTTLPRK